MAAATSVVNYRGLQQMGSGLFSEMWAVTCTLDAGSIAAGAGETETVAVPGVALGDMVIGISFGVDLADMLVTGYVQAANAVELRISADSGAGSDLASTTVKFIVARPAW